MGLRRTGLGGSGVRLRPNATLPWSTATRPTLTVPVKNDQELADERGLAAIWRQPEVAAAPHNPEGLAVVL